MEVHCLRHGQTIENIKGIFHGTSDSAVTVEQRLAITRVHFDASPYDAIYCSPLSRCCETAQALGILRWRTAARRYSARPMHLSRFSAFSGHELSSLRMTCDWSPDNICVQRTRRLCFVSMLNIYWRRVADASRSAKTFAHDCLSIVSSVLLS